MKYSVQVLYHEPTQYHDPDDLHDTFDALYDTNHLWLAKVNYWAYRIVGLGEPYSLGELVIKDLHERDTNSDHVVYR